jgi:hypothetical protein
MKFEFRFEIDFDWIDRGWADWSRRGAISLVDTVSGFRSNLGRAMRIRWQEENKSRGGSLAMQSDEVTAPGAQRRRGFSERRRRWNSRRRSASNGGFESVVVGD